MLVVVYQLGDARAAMLVRQIEFAAAVLLYVVVLRLRVVAGSRRTKLIMNH